MISNDLADGHRGRSHVPSILLRAGDPINPSLFEFLSSLSQSILLALVFVVGGL
jgi:hypothetical protein